MGTVTYLKRGLSWGVPKTSEIFWKPGYYCSTRTMSASPGFVVSTARGYARERNHNDVAIAYFSWHDRRICSPCAFSRRAKDRSHPVQIPAHEPARPRAEPQPNRGSSPPPGFRHRLHLRDRLPDHLVAAPTLADAKIKSRWLGKPPAEVRLENLWSLVAAPATISVIAPAVIIAPPVSAIVRPLVTMAPPPPAGSVVCVTPPPPPPLFVETVIVVVAGFLNDRL